MCPLDEDPQHGGPAAYKVCLARGPIRRRLRDDREAVLVIGHTANLGRCLQEFRRGLASGKGQSEANRLNWINAMARAEEPIVEEDLQCTFVRLDSEGIAKRLEAAWLKKYAQEFCELPPLNGAVPASCKVMV